MGSCRAHMVRSSSSHSSDFRSTPTRHRHHLKRPDPYRQREKHDQRADPELGDGYAHGRPDFILTDALCPVTPPLGNIL